MEFRLSEQQPTGGTYREHLSAAEQQLGEPIAELHPDPPPSEVAHLWVIFSELHNTRGSNGFTFLPITYAEMDAWQRLSDRPLRAWEVAALKRIDTAFIVSNAKKTETK